MKKTKNLLVYIRLITRLRIITVQILHKKLCKILILIMNKIKIPILLNLNLSNSLFRILFSKSKKKIKLLKKKIIIN